MTVNNANPIVNAGTDSTIDEGQGATFNGSFTDPGILDTHTITWDFGDGTTVTGILNPTHLYNSAGTYTATMTVRDNLDAATTDTLEVQVDNVAPILDDISVPKKVYQLDPIDFTARATDPGNDLTYIWNFGDGTDPVTGQNPNHIYAESGEYNATVTVIDSSGASDTLTVTVYVGSTAPFEQEDPNEPDGNPEFDEIFGDTSNFDDIWA